MVDGKSDGELGDEVKDQVGNDIEQVINEGEGDDQQFGDQYQVQIVWFKECCDGYWFFVGNVKVVGQNFGVYVEYQGEQSDVVEEYDYVCGWGYCDVYGFVRDVGGVGVCGSSMV